MANPTTNFGWVMPTSTSLVTNLPADFNTFGQGVDTSMAQLKGGTTGQILSKTSATDMAFTWITPNPGDITGVTAGTGISGGGTSGDVTITNSMATAMTTKGDLVPATGSGTFSRLAVGANNTVLTADSSTATGLKWASAAAGGGWQVVKAETTFTSVASTGTTFDSIFSSSYNYYMVEIKALGGGTAATDDLQLQMLYSGTTQAAGYYGTSIGTTHNVSTPTSNGTSGATQFLVAPDSCGNATTGDRITGVMNFYQCQGTSATAAVQGQLLAGYNYGNWTFAGQSSVARTFTGFLLKCSSGNISGTLAVYGLA